MLKRINRLAARRDIDALFKRGRPFHSKNFLAKVSNGPARASRFAFVVGTKVSKESVTRNRLKRRMREVVRLHFSSVRDGFDVMLSAKTGADKLPYVCIEEELIGLLLQSGVLTVDEKGITLEK